MSVKQSISEWLDSDPPKSEIRGDEETGFSLGIDVVKEKIKVLKKDYEATIDYNSFSHFIYTAPDKKVFASGQIQITLNFSDGSKQQLCGAATIDVQEYWPNQHFGATIKSLALCNALFEYPQFGGDLNKSPERKEKMKQEEKLTEVQLRFKKFIDACESAEEVKKYKLMIPEGMQTYYDNKIKSFKK